MKSNIKALDFKVENTGKAFKALKKQYQWVLGSKTVVFSVGFITEKFSSSRVVLLNDQEIFIGTVVKNQFSHSFKANKHVFTVIEDKNSVDLHVDGLSFFIIHKRQEASFLHTEKFERPVSPLQVKPSVFDTGLGKELKDWEKTAKNFRLIPREIPAGSLREKVVFYPREITVRTERSSLQSVFNSVSPLGNTRSSMVGKRQSFNKNSIQMKDKKKTINHFLRL